MRHSEERKCPGGLYSSRLWTTAEGSQGVSKFSCGVFLGYFSREDGELISYRKIGSATPMVIKESYSLLQPTCTRGET